VNTQKHEEAGRMHAVVVPEEAIVFALALGLESHNLRVVTNTKDVKQVFHRMRDKIE
jgi:hypothetical protein